MTGYQINLIIKIGEEYGLLLTSEDSNFKMMCYGTRGTRIKV